MAQDAPKPHNIFEAASRMEHERHEKERPTPTAAPPSKKTSLDEIFRQCHQMHQEIAESLDRAFKQAGVTPSQLRTFVSKPKNFSSRDWDKVEAGRKQSDQLLTVLKSQIGTPTPSQQPPTTPPEAKKPPTEPPPQPPQPKKKPKIMTKRQWIGM
jgi:hypothetical protein